jgi:hypothetical protein
LIKEKMADLTNLPFEYNTAVIAKKLFSVFLSIWLIVSLVILLWGVWPHKYESRKLVVPGFGQLDLEWNPENRTGDISIVRLKLATQNDESLLVSSQSTSVGRYMPFLKSQAALVKKTSKLIEARLEIPAVEMKPRETVGQSFQPGDEIVFYWNINSRSEGDFQGRIWLYTGNSSFFGGSEDRYPVAVQSVELQWRDLFGLSGMAARYTGIFGLITGILLVSLLWMRNRQAQIGRQD